MKIAERILHGLCTAHRSPWDDGHPGTTSKAGTADHDMEYAFMQLSSKVKNGIGVDVYGKVVLEIGCGHGGISVFAALNGAKSVTGIDLSEQALDAAGKFVARVEGELGRKLALEPKPMHAEHLECANEFFDVVIADNIFEHVSSVEDVLNECKRVLKPGGKVVVPNFPSIHSMSRPILGKVVFRVLPLLKRTRLDDIVSYGTSAVPRKEKSGSTRMRGVAGNGTNL